jgi:hypothetical protein
MAAVSMSGALGRGALQNVEQHLFIADADFGETRVPGPVGRQGILRNPAAAGVLVKVDARVGGLLHGRDVQAGG